jgi:hypothetical protein
MSTESPCYKTTRGVNNNPVPLDNLRLETSASCFCLLSYHHMDFARFEAAKDRDTLTISFVNHQVRITGRNLRELALAIQSRAVEFIKPMPGRYTSATGSESVFVESIEVEQNYAQQSNSQESAAG